MKNTMKRMDQKQIPENYMRKSDDQFKQALFVRKKYYSQKYSENTALRIL